MSMAKSNFATREKIKNTKSIVGEPFKVEAWDAFVNIRKWNGKQRAMLLLRVSEVYGTANDSPEETQAAKKNYPAMNKLMAEAIAISVCGEDETNLYDVNNPSDVDEIELLDADVLQSLYEECASRNGFLDKKLKDEIKNLEATQS